MSPLGGKGRLRFESLQTFLDGSEEQHSDLERAAGQGFDYLTDIRCCLQEHVRAFKDLANYSNTLQAFCIGQLPHIETIQILDSRNEVTHRILSLPTGAELADSEDEVAGNSNTELRSIDRSYLPVYDCCRIAAMLYSVTVAFPIRRSQYARQILVQALMEVLLLIDPVATDPKLDDQRCGSIFLWCLVVGGCCAGGIEPLSLQEWYMDTIVLFSAQYEVETWHSLKEILNKFAWLNNACNQSAKSFWTESWKRIGIETA